MVRCRISGLSLGSFMAQRALSWIGTQHVHGTQQPIRTLETVVGMMKSGNTQIFVWFEEGDLLKDWLWVKIPTAWHLEILPLGNRTWQYLALESSLSAEDFPNFPWYMRKFGFIRSENRTVLLNHTQTCHDHHAWRGWRTQVVSLHVLRVDWAVPRWISWCVLYNLQLFAI